LNPPTTRNRRPRRSKTLSRYLISEMVLPSLLALAAFGLVVLLTDLLGYADLIVNRGLGPGEVAQIAGLQLVPTLSRTLPFAVLVGSLVGLGRLSADRELLALETSGLSARQLARPGLLFALAATVLSVLLTVVVAPAAQRSVRDKMIELSEEKPGLALRAGLATSLGGWRIEARQIEDEGARLSGVLLYMPSLDETVFSRRGIVHSDERGERRLVLEDGLVLSNSPQRASLLRFERMEALLPTVIDEGDLPVDPIAALPFDELIRAARRTEDPSAARWAQIEAHRRLALGAAALPFGLLAIGLALGRRDLSRSGGTVMGLAGAIAYYALVQLAEGLLRDESAPVALVVWLPNMVLVAVATALLYQAGRQASESDRSGGRSPSRLLESAGLRGGLRTKRYALPRYVSVQFVRMVAICIAGLVFAYLVIDVFDNLKWFNKYGSTADEIARYYGSRLPVLIGRVIPMALLIAVALTISLLGAHGELLGMRACGIPVFRVLAPVWLLCGLAVPAYHLLSNEIVPRATAEASRVKREEIKGQNSANGLRREKVWYRVGPRIYEMKLLDLLSGQADDVTLYDLDPDGLPLRRTDATRAISLPSDRGLWLLENARSIELTPDGRLERPVDVPRLAEIGEETPSEIETAHMTPRDLRAALAEPNLESPIISAYQTDLQMKIAAPLACLLLPLIALFFAATGPPFPRPVHTLIACAIIAVSHALATSFSGSLGYGGTIDPLLAGWGPSILFGAVAAGMGMRLRRKLSRSG